MSVCEYVNVCMYECVCACFAFEWETWHFQVGL